MLLPLICLLCACVFLANMRLWPRVGRAAAAAAPAAAVSVLIPMRNEADRIRACLEALGSDPAIREILVYDDHSDDRGPQQVRDAAERDPRIRLLAPVALPADWYGKPFACSRLAAEARTGWLLFIDADVQLMSGAVGRIVTEAARRDATLLSCWPGLAMQGFWEQTLMPMLNFVVFTLYPSFLAECLTLPALGLAHGACILARRDAYERMGGHERVKGELFEDTALARAWRRAKLRGLCLDGQDVLRVRMYTRFADIWRGFQKNIYPAFRHEPNFWLFLALHAGCFTLPFVMLPYTLLRGEPYQAWAVCTAAVLTMRAAETRRFGYAWWPVLLHPAASLLMLALGLTSWVRCRAGGGVTWKNRTYPGRQA